MEISVTAVSVDDIRPLRERYRREMKCQLVHDSLHRRPGWTTPFLLTLHGEIAGYASLAVAGPWTGKPTLFELFIVPERRSRLFELVEALLAASGARFFEIQNNDPLLNVVAHTYGRNVVSEKIIFADTFVTALPANGATLRRVTSDEESRRCFEQRQGSSECELVCDGLVVGEGGVAFHYNPPYGDVYMSIEEPYQRRGLGSYFVQELKQVCRDLGGIPGARCNPDNIASRRTLQKAGFVPYAHILTIVS